MLRTLFLLFESSGLFTPNSRQFRSASVAGLIHFPSILGALRSCELSMWSHQFLAPLQLHLYRLGMCTPLNASLKLHRSEPTRSKLRLCIGVSAD